MLSAAFAALVYFGLGALSGWIGCRIYLDRKTERRAKRGKPVKARSTKDWPMVDPVAIPELRPKKEPKTTTNVRKLQSHRAALMELCALNGLGVEARELIEDVDQEMEFK